MANLQFEQIVNDGLLYINGLALSNNATTPNTQFNVAAGQCRDATNEIDMILGNYLGVNANQSANTSTTVNAAVNGANGLDTGSLAASTMYNIFVIADPTGFKATSVICTAAAIATGPLMPQGYGVSRYIGSILTDSSSHFLLTYYSGNGSLRYAQYDAPIAVTVTGSGTSATYSAMDLSVAVPLTSFGRVAIKYKWTPAAAADALNFTPTGATGDFQTILGQVAAVAIENNFIILPLIAAAKPEISYKTSAGTLNNVWVQGYDILL
jgi:hypothetical protein